MHIPEFPFARELYDLFFHFLQPFFFYIAAQSTVILKAETLAEKTEWLNKLKNVISSKGGQVIAESSQPMRPSLSEGTPGTPVSSKLIYLQFLPINVPSVYFIINSFFSLLHQKQFLQFTRLLPLFINILLHKDF